MFTRTIINNSNRIPSLYEVRLISTKLNNNEIKPVFTNRNPRNLERLRIGYKPDGYHLEAPGRRFWHKLDLEVSGKYVSASVSHYANGPVLKASTKEWAIKEQLYRYKDTAAYINLGRVLAQRCMESGITEMYSGLDSSDPNLKVSHFVKTLQDSGITLTEPDQFKPPRPMDQLREEKPWEIIE